MSAGNDRVRRFFRGDAVDLERLNAAKRAFENLLRLSAREFKSRDDLEGFMMSRGNELLLIPLRSVKVRDPLETLDTLYAELVGGRAHREPVRHRFAELDALFNRPDLRARVSFDQRVAVPKLGRILKIPYAFTNGIENLVLRKVFHTSVPTDAAMKLVVEGDLLFRYAKKKLIVVARFEEDRSLSRSDPSAIPNERVAFQEVGNLFTEYNTRLVLASELGPFAEEVVRNAQ